MESHGITRFFHKIMEVLAGIGCILLIAAVVWVIAINLVGFIIALLYAPILAVTAFVGISEEHGILGILIFTAVILFGIYYLIFRKR